MFGINPFKKKLPVREEPAREQFLPQDLERFRVQPAEPPPLEAPEHERKFRAFAREMDNPSDMGIGFGERTGGMSAERSASENKSSDTEKIDMVLQKLETIDLRLKLIEQKLERRVV